MQPPPSIRLAAALTKYVEPFRKTVIPITVKMPRSDGESDNSSQISEPCLTSFASWDGFSSTEGKSRRKENIVSLDCEMVGVGEKRQSALARCSIIDYHGRTLFDKYIKPKRKITDYRTRFSGIKPIHMQNAISLCTAKRKIKQILRNKILVGHALHMDLRVLGLHISASNIRDTSKYPALKILSGLPMYNTPSLRNLSRMLLGRTIQERTHCSIEDATAALDLYKYVEEEWEEELDAKHDSRKYLKDQFWPPWL